MKKNLFQYLTLSLLSLFGLAANATDINQNDLLAKMKSADKPIVIDVRSAQEYAAGHVPGAINIPHDIIGQQMSQLGLEKKTAIVLYCRSGYRAGKANKVLIDSGYHNLSHLAGDYKAWDAKGLPQTKGSNP